MYTRKALCDLYGIHYETLHKRLIATGVISQEQTGRGNKPLLGYEELLPFFQRFGDRTGDHEHMIAVARVKASQLNLFNKK